MEQWKNIPGWEGEYLCNNLGDIKSIKFGKEKLLKLVLSNNGYHRVELHNSPKKPKKYRVHRLIYEAFIQKIPKGLEINHKNGIKTDNRLENLELSNRSHNQLHALKNGLKIPRKGKHHWGNKRIQKFTQEDKFIEEYFSIINASEKNNILRQSIQNCIKGKSKTAGGYKWRIVT